MSAFPSFDEIQQIKEKHRRHPTQLHNIKLFIECVLNEHADKIRKAARSGLTDYNLGTPFRKSTLLRDLEISEPDLYRMLEAELRRRGYHTLLSIYNENTGEMFCELMISW